MNQKQRRALSIVLISMLAFACAPVFAAPAPPTLDPNSVNTVIAGTAGAAATQTALLTPPTWTSIPTYIPSVTPASPLTATETFVFLVPTWTPTFTQTVTLTASTPSHNYDCSVVEQSPLNGTVLPRRTDFQAKWIIMNTGFKAWSAGDTDFVYASGADLHKKRGYDLVTSVEPGGTTTLVVDMETPAQKDTYSTVWQLVISDNEFCKLRLTIDVQ